MSSAIRRVHEKCFEILEDYFGLHHKHMKKKKQDVWEGVWESLKAYDNQLAGSVHETFNQELMNLDWNAHINSIKRLGGTKALYEAITPDVLAAGVLIKRVSLYADTIVLTGLVPRVSDYLRMRGLKSERFRSLESSIFLDISTSLALLEIKDLFFADVEKPIIVLSTPLAYSTSDLVRTCMEITKHDALELGSYIFGRKIPSLRKLREFVLKHRNLEDLIKSIRRPEFFKSPPLSIKASLLAAMKAHTFSDPSDDGNLAESERLAGLMETMIARATSRSTCELVNSSMLRAKPTTVLLDEWELLRWRFRKDNCLLAKQFGLEKTSPSTLVLNALQLDDFKWLGNVPLEGILKMREEGELENIRDILSRGIKEIETVKDDDFVNVATQVRHNLNEEFNRHKARVQSLDEKFRRKYKIDVASLAVTGCVSAISALFPPLAVVAGAIGGGSLVKIMHDGLEERSKKEELRRKPIGLLFSAYQDTMGSMTRSSESTVAVNSQRRLA